MNEESETLLGCKYIARSAVNARRTVLSEAKVHAYLTASWKVFSATNCVILDDDSHWKRIIATDVVREEFD